MNKEEKVKKINSFISLCVDSNGDSIPDGYTYLDVSKVVSERYSTQKVELVKVFFRSKGKKGNNKPYSYPEELPVGTSNLISNDLFDIRTNASFAYGDIIKTKEKESISIDPDLLPFDRHDEDLL